MKIGGQIDAGIRLLSVQKGIEGEFGMTILNVKMFAQSVQEVGLECSLRTFKLDDLLTMFA